jgi:hypothetical protein
MTTNLEACISIPSLLIVFAVGMCAIIRMNKQAPYLERAGLIFMSVGAFFSAIEWIWPELRSRWPSVFYEHHPVADQIMHIGMAMLAIDIARLKSWGIIRRLRERMGELA